MNGAERRNGGAGDDRVKTGDKLVVLETMKMETLVTAPKIGPQAARCSHNNLCSYPVDSADHNMMW